MGPASSASVLRRAGARFSCTLMLGVSACGASGPVSGPADAHCAGVTPPTVGACAMEADAAVAPNARVNHGTAADDDDCRYHATWDISQPSAGSAQTVSLTLSLRGGGGPVSGAAPTVSVALGDGAPTPQAATATEPSPGHYTLAPVRFAKAGRYTLRFDLFPTCSPNPDADGAASPRAHVAFYVDVN